ncbi:MAG: Asp-tRNA(Asn)/Glu-tRNA(Gln) amidotransferase subunit GatC [Candidatus Poribacteria bacterium]|nr:Asp-tRNA(Asn)/Glu-tRNA(Gln) amidotransferase subunit GatC [Candidatus Poribacteria bacterium]
MPKLTNAEVEYVATLARLELSDDEKERLTSELGSILEYIDQLNALDTSDVEPTSHVLPIRNVMREDVVADSMPREEALELAPSSDDEFFIVPRVVE